MATTIAPTVKTITATFHFYSASGNSACVSFKANPYNFESTVGYMSSEPVLGLEDGAKITLPSIPEIYTKKDSDGNLMICKNGEPRTFFRFN